MQRLRPIAWLALLALCSCALNPVTKTPEVVFTSTRKEAEIGASAAREVEKTVGLVRDAELAVYVKTIGARIAALSPRQDVEYRFGIVDMDEPNAFALPGGYIYISRGLLAIAQNEDQVAGVLAHEVVHVAARHSVQRETAALPVGILSALGSLAGGLVGGRRLAQVVGGIPELAGGLLLAKYGREQELEADRVGQRLVAEAGWDPAELADILEIMERVVAEDVAAAGEEEPTPSWFDSHPTTPERVSGARQRAEGLEREPAQPIVEGAEAFLMELDGLLAGPDPGEGIFRKELYLHPDLGLAVRFPLGWKTYNGRDVVAASAPEGDAVVAMRLHARGDDPRAAAVAFALKDDLTLSDLEEVTLNGLPAVRALAGVRAGRQTFVADFTFIARDGLIYRITGAAPVSRYERRAREMIGVAQSFRDLAPDEREFVVRRIRIVRAAPGETVGALSRRTGNMWPIARTAAANDLDVDAALAAGTLVRIVRTEPYVPIAEASR